MAVDPTDPSRLGEALWAILSWATPSGMIALVCAWFGYKHMQRRELQETLPPNTSMALATLYSDRLALEQTAMAIARQATALEALTRAVEEHTRELRYYNENRHDRRK